MNMVIILLKFLFYSVLGFYIITYSNKIFNLRVPLLCEGVVSPFFGIFGLISIFNPFNNIFLVFLMGVVGAFVLKVLLNLYVPNYPYDINILSFGVLNIINVYIINNLFEFIINHSSYASIMALFTFGVIVYTADIIYTLRNKML